MFLSTPDERLRTPFSTLSVASLMIAAVGFLQIICFPIAIVLAHIALYRVKRAKKRGLIVRGRGFAIATLWLSYGFIAIFTVSMLVLVVAALTSSPA